MAHFKTHAAILCLCGMIVAPLQIAPSPAFAEQTPNTPQATRLEDLTEAQQLELTTLLSSGNDAYEAGKYPEALESYKKALAIIELPILVYRIAFCFDQLDRREEALAFYKRFLALEPDASDRGRIETEIARLEKELARTRIARVKITSEPSGAMVTLDGAPIGETPLTHELPPGAHELAFSLDGHVPQRAAIEAKGGEEMTVAIAMPLEQDPYRPAKITGWSILGAGVATTGLATILTINANAATEAFNEAPSSTPTPTKQEHERALGALETTRRNAKIAQGAAVGVLSIGAGVLLWSYTRQGRVSEDDADARSHLHLNLRREEVGVGWTLRF